MRELENASAKVHISRLEALKLQCQQEAEKLYGNYTDAIDAHIADIYTGEYYHTAYELQKGVGVGSVLNEFNSNLVDKVIHKPWAVDGRNFSNRIWTDKTRLINNLHNSLTKMCITGEAPDWAIREISQNMHVSRQQAARIVQTEAAAFSSMAQEDCYKDLNVEQFEVVSTLDSGTCHSCGSMDGNHFPMTEYQIGVTVPPFHPRCRCCTAPYFGDEYDNIGKRAARDETGKTYDVPADMTYREWEEKFINSDPETKKKHDTAVKSNQNRTSDSEQYNRYKDVLGKSNVPETLEDFQEMKYNKPSIWNQLKHDYRIVNSYEDNAGHMDVKKILELDAFAFNTKTQHFTGKAKRKGNIAVMELDGKIKVANSQLNNMTGFEYSNFKGDKQQLVFKKDNLEFSVIKAGSHLRDMDSEAKLFEYAADIAKDGKKHVIQMLSEKCMCDSCLGVMNQFKTKYPNVEVNVVSNKKERDTINHGKPWKHRQKG